MLTMSSFYVYVSPDLWDRFIPDRKCWKCLLLFNVDHVIILCVRVSGSARSVYSRQEMFLSQTQTLNLKPCIADIDCSRNFWWSLPVEFGIAVCKGLSSNLWPGPDLLPEIPTLASNVDHVIILCVCVPDLWDRFIPDRKCSCPKP
jgi:hypothetical protein